jgi:hypothetical protein
VVVGKDFIQAPRFQGDNRFRWMVLSERHGKAKRKALHFDLGLRRFVFPCRSESAIHRKQTFLTEKTPEIPD